MIGAEGFYSKITVAQKNIYRFIMPCRTYRIEAFITYPCCRVNLSPHPNCVHRRSSLRMDSCSNYRSLKQAVLYYSLFGNEVELVLAGFSHESLVGFGAVVASLTFFGVLFFGILVAFLSAICFIFVFYTVVFIQ